ncbi:hypothetical protein GCM10010116_00130 [Microbispora rosea subsp. aerata]|nr:hypothetical protein GCM10010116_00130 [Microbispora rosea subsp. aerata]
MNRKVAVKRHDPPKPLNIATADRIAEIRYAAAIANVFARFGEKSQVPDSPRFPGESRRVKFSAGHPAADPAANRRDSNPAARGAAADIAGTTRRAPGCGFPRRRVKRPG